MKETPNVKFHTYETIPCLEFAGDDFGYEMEEVFDRFENPEETLRKRAERKKELDELAKSYVRKRLTNKEAIAYWKETGKWDEIKDRLWTGKEATDKDPDAWKKPWKWTTVCEPGPLRAEPGLVGVWKQEGEHEWRQIGLNPHAEWIFQIDKRAKCIVSGKKHYKEELANWGKLQHFASVERCWAHSIGTARTCRYLIWMSKDLNDHYKSAFYSREELEYLSSTRLSFNDLLDCSLLYATDDIRAFLDMPVTDYMYVMQCHDYCGGWHSSPEKLTEMFYELAHKAMSTNIYKFPVVFPINCRSYSYDEVANSALKVGQYIDLNNPDYGMLYSSMPALLYFREYLLLDYLTEFRILKEHGPWTRAFTDFDNAGKVDEVIRYYKRLEEWVDLYGTTPLYDSDRDLSHMWMITLMDKDGLAYIYNMCKHQGFTLEGACDYALHCYREVKSCLEPNGNMMFPNPEAEKLYKVVKPVFDNPAMDADTDRSWKFIARKYFGGWPSQEEYEEKCRQFYNRLFGHQPKPDTGLSDMQTHKLQETLPLFHLTEEKFWAMSDDEFKLMYHEFIKAAHPDTGGNEAEATKINVAYKILIELRESKQKG